MIQSLLHPLFLKGPNRVGRRPLSASARLQGSVALASAAVLSVLLAAFAAVTLLSGGGPWDLAAPAAGALLAFATEMLCLNAAIRRVERLRVDVPCVDCPDIRGAARV